MDVLYGSQLQIPSAQAQPQPCATLHKHLLLQVEAVLETQRYTFQDIKKVLHPLPECPVARTTASP